MQNSPALSNNPFPSSSTPNSFMDTFDFGNPDFSTANSGLEDLNIFPSTDAAASVSSQPHNPQSEPGSAPVSHHPSPSAATMPHAASSSDANAPLHSGSTTHNAGVYLNNVSHASSPLAFTRNRFDNNSSASPQAGGSEHGHNRQPSAAPSDLNFGSFAADQSRAAPPMQSSHSQNNDQQLSQMPQLSISDLQRMLLERERTERIQNMQTALLKQQLDQLSRLQQQQQHLQGQQQQQTQPQHQQQQHQQQQHNAQNAGGPPSNLQLNLSGSAGQLSPGQSQSLLMALQNAFAAGNNPNAHHNVLQAAQYQQQQQPQQQQQQSQPQNAWQQQQQQPQQINGAPGQPGAGGDQSNVLAQYGLITPMGSGPFNSSACPPGSANFMSPLTIQPNSHPGSVGVEHRPGHDYLGNYTPLESPAVTPASVFSTGSTGIVMSELFSPLTSPALGPQPPSLGEMMLPPAQLHQSQHHQQASQQAVMHGSPAVSAVSNFTPTASPLALIAKGSSKIRKNRSTTAEARANKVRPSPLIKPVAGPSIKKKKDASSLASPSTATPLVNGNGHANGGSSGPGSRRASITGVTDVAASGSHSRHQSADVPHSEGTSSTPSPIDLSGGGAMPPPSGPTNKILTPSSIMGIRSSPGSGADQRQASSPNNRGSAMKGKARDDLQQQSQQQQQQQMMMQQAQMGMPAQAPAPGGHHVYPNIAPFPSSAQPTAPKVTFNLPPQMSGMPIQPGGLSQADRDAWMTYKSAGGLESRRTSHKAAEQKRRDSLKFCFDELRGLLPAITLDEDAPNGSLLGADGAEEDRDAEQFEPSDVGDPEMARSANKAISKVALLRHSNEYLVRMKKRLERRDAALAVCRNEVHELRQKLGLPPSDDPSVTGRGAPLGWTDESTMSFDLADDSPEGKHEMDQTA
ncbi:conserved hypothetical protein [Sporisorium reilianum SRZ2]|uniref:BHLH domain-containing protein n=1 Tax=Sporisorium reilianum (strain SRZ2) TaxID=999809 RepID=E7A0Y7_SPORE|nr:conserved hypothetical protein [Sporisorium reilianum SRZ2]